MKQIIGLNEVKNKKKQKYRAQVDNNRHIFLQVARKSSAFFTIFILIYSFALSGNGITLKDFTLFVIQ